MEKLVNDSKQIVMAGHWKWNKISIKPRKLKHKTVQYNTNYNLKSIPNIKYM